MLSPRRCWSAIARYRQVEALCPAEHRRESAAYSDAPGLRSVGICNLLASFFAFFPWS